MIFLEIPVFRHYVFAVVQTSSSPTHPGGNPPLVRNARAKQPSDGSGGSPAPTVIQQEKTKGTFTTGTVALLFKPQAISSVEAAILQNFPSFPCFPWTKNGLWALAHAKSFRVFRG